MTEVDGWTLASKLAARHMSDEPTHNADVIEVLSGDVAARCEDCDWHFTVDPCRHRDDGLNRAGEERSA